MKINRPFLLISLLAVSIVLSACGGDSNNPTPVPDSNAYDPKAVIKDAIASLQATSSFHFKLDVKGQSAAGSSFFIKGGEGDYAKPNAVKAQVKAVYAGSTVNARYAGKEDKQFIAIIGCWQPFTGLSLAPDKAAADIMNNIADLKAAGSEDVDRTPSYRMSGKINAQQLAALSPEATQKGDVAVDMWVGQADKQLRRVLLKGAISTGDQPDASYDITFANFNQPVTVDLPPDNELCKK